MKKDGTTGYWWTELTGLQAGKEYAFQYAERNAADYAQFLQEIEQGKIEVAGDEVL